jgi:hypothetical protein
MCISVVMYFMLNPLYAATGGSGWNITNGSSSGGARCA